MKILSVVGARPNFMKIAPFCRALEEQKARNLKRDTGSEDGAIEHVLVHTGQHYDQAMSDSFFESLGIPEPDVNLGVGSGSHAEQVGTTMIAFETVIREHKPDWVVVVGDVNATLACSITAKKEGVMLAHIEAGLRSFDLEMPEEINRIVTDRLSDLLFTTDDLASENLRKEGVPEEKIAQVGNIMIDTLETHRLTASNLNVGKIIGQNWHTDNRGQAHWNDTQRFSVVTLHRPSNVDDQLTLSRIVRFLTDEVSQDMAIVWPVHPRTRQRLVEFGLWDDLCAKEKVLLLYPIGYIEMLRLNMSTDIMITDSGGIQEECCVLGTPCLTLRWNTERPITLLENGGASMLVGNDIDGIRDGYQVLQAGGRMVPHSPPLWDGGTADRIARILVDSQRLDRSRQSNKVQT